MLNSFAVFLTSFFCIVFVSVAEQPESQPPPPLFEYGMGAGFIRYAHYPASDQTKDVGLPFPTFQYRGEILRADDRDGAKAVLINESKWTLDIGGGFLPTLKSNDNKARQGMDPLLWSAQIGPQLIYEFTENLGLKLGVYQSFVSDFRFTKTNGYVFEQRIDYWVDSWFKDNVVPRLSRNRLTKKIDFFSRVSFSVLSGSRDYLGTYFDVETKDRTPERAAFRAEEGLLSYTFGFFQTVRIEKTNLYFGFAHADFDRSVNRESPLHRSDRNLAVFLGFNYMLGESESRAVPEESSEGLLQKVHPNRH